MNHFQASDKRTYNLLLVNVTKNAVNPNITDIHTKCVQRCEDFPDYKKIVNRCYLMKGNQTEPSDADITSFFSGVAEDLARSWLPILLSCLVAFVFSYVLLVLFRYAIKYVIWVIYIGIIVALAGGSIAFLVLYFAAKNGTPQEKEAAIVLLIVSGVLALVAIVIALVLFFFRKRIRLVIQLFKEASKALADIPMLIVEPSLTFLAMGLSSVAFLYFAIIIESSGNLEVQNDERGMFVKAEYVKNAAMSATHYINLVAFMWFTSFILGCQNFVIASAVSQWFFTRSKDKLDSPISRGFSLLLRFHLGSVCLGSILITLIKILRMLVENVKVTSIMFPEVHPIKLQFYFQKSLRDSGNVAAKIVACCCDFIMEQLETLLQYIVRNAYIIVAKDGTPLIESGKKAFNLLLKNLMDVVALNQVGDLVLVLGRLFVVLIAGFVSYELVDVSSYPEALVDLSIIYKCDSLSRESMD